MSFLKSLFGKKKPMDKPTLNHPNELQLNDIFTFGDSFALPEAMRKQQLQVIDIHTLEFQHQHYAQIIGQGSGQQLIYLSFPDNPKKLIKLSLLLSRNEVEALFDLDAFSEIFEEPGNARLTSLTKQHSYGDMVADEYIQEEFMISGYSHQQDYRGMQPPQFAEEQHGREFEYHSLEGGAGERSVDIFIFENGDTDVYLSFLRPANEITELWMKGE
jgi:hypothetical protein